LSYLGSRGVLRCVLIIHIIFVIGALYRHRTTCFRYEFNNYKIDSTAQGYAFPKKMVLIEFYTP